MENETKNETETQTPLTFSSKYFTKIVIALTILLCALIVVVVAFSSDTKTVTKSGTQIEFSLANNFIERWAGLSWKSQEDLDTAGMLFTFRDEKERTFWMRGMKFDLDVLWIKDGKIMKIDSGVKAPVGDESIERMSSSPFAVDAVIELPAGQARALGFKRGMTLKELVD